MNQYFTRFLSFLVIILATSQLYGQGRYDEKFESIDPWLPTPNVYRTGSGAPGHQYWQQRADYEIEAEIDDERQRLKGFAKITYFNQSPDRLNYLWLQLDQNMRAKDSDTYKSSESRIQARMSSRMIQSLIGLDFDGGHKIEELLDGEGKPLPYTINRTMMRVDLPKALAPGDSLVFQIRWNYNINDRDILPDRGGYEYFEKDGNYVYTIAQWFPRMAVYDDLHGWQHKQFLGAGEFALTFGDYKVSITVPADHVVGSTGELQNPEQVLSSQQRERWEKAKTAGEPVEIVTQREAERAEKSKSKEKKTWVYHAENVRDFAFTSSRKFIWDAMGVKQGDRTIMAMSYYPKEANPLWGQYSTRAVAHTLDVYSHYTFDYPYPVAISVEAANGMEYPMICFNYGRPAPDGTYSSQIKYGMISVIIHEVGHNYFPMIVNSDERQWTWMDEGLNSFLQFLAEQEWEENYPHRRGPAYKIIPYMKGSKEGQRPIMTQSDNVLQLGPNAYGKPATALNILRETILSRELFDHAFKEYSQRWMFRHPHPADFFRTMEDASGTDLDWFWRGWFYTTDHVDISVDQVEWYKLGPAEPATAKREARQEAQNDQEHISKTRNNQEGMKRYVDRDPKALDFYNSYDPYVVDPDDQKEYKEFVAKLDVSERDFLNNQYNFYEVQFSNLGGLVMPLILEFHFKDGSSEIQRIPAEIWRKNENQISKVFAFKKELKELVFDPYRETADVDESNNFWPRRQVPTRFEMYKNQNVTPRGQSGANPMQKKKK